MRAVIVEIRDNVAAVLSEDGMVLKVKNRGYAVGQKITLKNINRYVKIAASAAAALVLFAAPAWAYLTPYSYVSLDINPSFEFSINMFDRVLDVKAVNNDGEKIVENISVTRLKNKKINEAVKSVIIELKDEGYIDESKKGGVVVAASSKSKKKTDELAASLKAAVEEEVNFKVEEAEPDKENKEVTPETENEEINVPVESETAFESETAPEQEIMSEPEIPETKEEPEESEEKTEEDKEEDKEEASKEISKGKKKSYKTAKSKFKVEVIEVRPDDVNEAKSNGVTPGKWNLIEKLQESAKYAGYTFGETEVKSWLNKSVQDIMEETKRYNTEEKQWIRQKTMDYNKKEEQETEQKIWDYNGKEEQKTEQKFEGDKEKSESDKEEKSYKNERTYKNPFETKGSGRKSFNNKRR